MKQLYKTFLTSIICASFCLPSYANTPILLSVEAGNGAQSGIINGYAGTSTSAPCSDLTLIYHSDMGKNIYIKPGTINTTSNDLIKHPGPGYACMRTDLIIAGKTYSSGNIQLTWDEVNHVYTDANPNRVVLNLPG